MKRLLGIWDHDLEMAVRDDTVGSNHDQMRKFVDFIKYDTPSYPEALSMILIRFKNSEGISSIHCLNLLDLCMEQLGHPFIIYVDRYNVLNMFVKRVHPKVL
ncbi:hypothetical protein RF11_14239 [Thelohanellus kitauei]|uniref:VHS domain-containing protein n=1 Tax=Thelohanellus kitauei TaxID=669202 RepID=A0A0C2MXI6_THEKT|nr:hypothetical protein RF11_14239 [Thelohanellus kitauei]